VGLIYNGVSKILLNMCMVLLVQAQDVPTCPQDVPCLSMSAGCAVIRLKQCVHAVVKWIQGSGHMARTGLTAGRRRW
jgi:hypothetical protein